MTLSLSVSGSKQVSQFVSCLRSCGKIHRHTHTFVLHWVTRSIIIIIIIIIICVSLDCLNFESKLESLL